MQQQTTHISPDGHWAWNGTSWVPNTTNAMTGSSVPPRVPEKARKRLGLKITGGILGVLLILGIATAAREDSGTVPASQDVASAPVTVGDAEEKAAEEKAAEEKAAEERAAEEKAAEEKAAEEKAAEEKAAEEKAAAAKEAAEKEAPAETRAQENARESAEAYLDYSAFSRKGLIDQLEFEGYSTKDATYAVDAISPNWNEQAAKSAEKYLDYSSFSRSGLIGQLEFEGFTHKQAVYGVDQAGL